eukprot:TRINITY_DN4451_c0_g2_i1.p1 TRINITY_DN4451_c0_g2~~TRINITY_DN4451_c0_g2_i1.p1  ORF type:complete len:493 (+),score=79.66 TRINITY_DN4451_c0_g2_i1:162-1640(+)
MILYDNREQLGAILALHGSTIYKQIPVALVAAGMSMVFVIWDREASTWGPTLDHPFAAQTFSAIVSFALVWRTSLAWSRYWEGCTQASFMYSKWADSFTQLVSFVNYGLSNLEDESSEEAMKKKAKLWEIKLSLAHNFSLLSALASHRLTHGDLARMRRRSQTFGLHSSVACGLCRLMRNRSKLFTMRQDLRFNDLTGAWELPKFTVLDIKSTEEVKAQYCQAEQAYFPAPSARSLIRGVKKTVMSVRRGSTGTDSSFGGASADSLSIEAVQNRRVTNLTWSSDLVIIGKCTAGESHVLEPSADRTGILVEWINEDINALIDVCGIPAPIVSRCYQELSNGMLGFSQTLKIADVPFPFPFTQLLIVILWSYSCIIPMYVAQFTKGIVITPILTFGITLAMWSLCEISIELENPFSDGPNQLPVIDMHERFVEMLRTVFQLKRHRRKKKVVPEEEAAAASDLRKEPPKEEASEAKEQPATLEDRNAAVSGFRL